MDILTWNLCPLLHQRQNLRSVSSVPQTRAGEFVKFRLNLASSTLWTMEPGQGYQILSTDPVTLVYPITSTMNLPLSNLPTQSADCPPIEPRPDFALLRGHLTVDGAAAPSGSRVDIITPRGEIAGCFVTQHDGVLGYTRAFGEDRSIGGEGFRAGEMLSFCINGRLAFSTAPIEWRSDLMPVAVDLTVTSLRVYLPIALK
jgi:hypothetical protein